MREIRNTEIDSESWQIKEKYFPQRVKKKKSGREYLGSYMCGKKNINVGRE